MGCGVIMDWYRINRGNMSDVQLSPTLAPFEDLKDDLLFVNGLDGIKCCAYGDHAQGTQSYLRATGTGGISVDQLAHNAHMQSNDKTRFGSLAVSGDGTCYGRDSGSPASALCAISWEGTGENDFKQRDSDPQALFNKLFSDFDPSKATEAAARRSEMDQSILDYVQDDISKLNQQLGYVDRQRLDRYLNSIQTLESKLSDQPPIVGGNCSPEEPQIVSGPAKARQLQALSDIIVMAFECDLARYVAYMFENGGSYTFYDFAGATDGHHQMSHNVSTYGLNGPLHGVEKFFYEQWAYFIRGLKNATDITGGNVLDSTFAVFSNEISHGNNHTHSDMPFLAAGSCNGFFKTGESIQSNANFGNVWVSVLEAIGHPSPSNRVGQGNGPATGLHT